MPEKLTKEMIQEQDKQLKDEIEKKNGKSVEELYAEREKRILDAVQGKVPDRVPVVFGGTYFAMKYVGLPYSTAYYDPATWKQGYKKMMAELEPDSYGTAANMEAGKTLEIMESNYTRWPGGPLPENVATQIVEHEYMKADEYDAFLADPSDFIVRVMLPRMFGFMEPLGALPPLQNIGMGISMMAPLFASPGFEKIAQKMKAAGEAQREHLEALGDFNGEMKSLGIPVDFQWMGGVMPPFSGFTNSFRTWKGIAMDMFRQPDKLLAALDKMLAYNIYRASPAVKQEGKPAIGASSEPHRVSDEFLSRAQFEKFVWPNWKKAVEKTFELGFDIISMFFEGHRDKQLDYFLEFPKHSMMIRMAETDIFRAKEILGDRASLMGNVPVTMLQVGSTTDVEEYCKKLIKEVGKDGGFILRCSTDYTQEAKPANVKAMIDTVKKYGKY
ncbi:MAG: hypothetical protein JW712_11800 [Dehalococcoidales bacterium]|nr:hypothetical protein [Dehalococcoidales bacterium]